MSDPQLQLRKGKSGSDVNTTAHTTDLSQTVNMDAGRKLDEYYEGKLSPSRYWVRSILQPLLQFESDYLYKIQTKLRCSAFDIYFAWTANLGSHMFYVLMLPIPLWAGYCQLLRDLVFVIGWGIYCTGLLKDYLCLPRPRSPPLHRITMSHYTSLEYGCPSSHSSNAVGVTVLLLCYVLPSCVSWWQWLLLVGVAGVYCFSIIFGRIYCGMHGFVDVAMGAWIGLSVFFVRYLLKDWWDELILNQDNWWLLIITVLLYYLSIYYHLYPVEECPCFEDSVLFMGVLLGVECINFYMNLWTDQSLPVRIRSLFPYEYALIGFWKTVLRFAIGVIFVVIWKTFSKILLTSLLKPLFKTEITNSPCWVFKKRNGLDIIVRLMVYAGISFVSMGCGYLFNLIGLSCEFRPEMY